MNGRALETFARRNLEALGYRILEQNFRLKSGEIDLIAEVESATGLDLVFVEVRGRDWGLDTALESVDHLKRMRIARVAQQYLVTYHGPADGVRFDVFVSDGEEWKIVPNAWWEC